MNIKEEILNSLNDDKVKYVTCKQDNLTYEFFYHPRTKNLLTGIVGLGTISLDFKTLEIKQGAIQKHYS